MQALKYVIIGVLLAAVGIFFLISAFRDYDLSHAIELVLQANVGPLFAALALSVASLLFCAGSFFFMLRSIGEKTNFVRAINYACTYIFFGNVTPAALGSQPMTVLAMRRDKADVTHAVIASLLNTILYKLLLICMGIVVLCYAPEIVLGNTLLTILYFWGMFFNLMFITVCAMAIWAYGLLRKIGTWGISLFARLRIIKRKEKWLFRFTHMMQRYREGGDYVLKHPSVACKMTACIFFQRIAAFSIAFFAVKSLAGEDAPFFALLAAQVAAALTVDSLPIPGGVGISESVTLQLYSGVFAEALVAPAMLLTRGIFFYFTTLFCGVVLLCFRIFRKKRKLPLSDTLNSEQ